MPCAKLTPTPTSIVSSTLPSTPAAALCRRCSNNKPNTHEVEVKATLGASGLGLILGKEKEGTRWTVKGFCVMADGGENPAAASLLFFVSFYAFIVCLRSFG